MTFALVAFMVVLVAVLLGAWWSQVARDPRTTVADFHRALSAMQPDGSEGAATGRDGAEARGEASERAR